jgi:glutamyl/glutaminyl-tRNA synthetase
MVGVIDTSYRKHYKVVILRFEDITENKIEEELEKYLSQGWELISFDWGSHSYPICVFKNVRREQEK